MKILYLRVVLCFVAVALVGAAMFEVSRGIGHQGCSCCSSAHKVGNKCHDVAKKTCLCNYQASQIFALRNDVVLNFVLSGYPVHLWQYPYFYQSGDDIFHPPRA